MYREDLFIHSSLTLMTAYGEPAIRLHFRELLRF